MYVGCTYPFIFVIVLIKSLYHCFLIINLQYAKMAVRFCMISDTNWTVAKTWE